MRLSDLLFLAAVVIIGAAAISLLIISWRMALPG
jgi:hypothetical protein